MSEMIRKQIYIQKSQEARLKKIAESRGVSEAEIIRRALEVELRHAGYRSAYNREAWERIRTFIFEMEKRGPVAPKKRDWKREDLYEDRMKRYDRNTH
jgi:hypothetical protein